MTEAKVSIDDLNTIASSYETAECKKDPVAIHLAKTVQFAETLEQQNSKTKNKTTPKKSISSKRLAMLQALSSEGGAASRSRLIELCHEIGYRYSYSKFTDSLEKAGLANKTETGVILTKEGYDLIAYASDNSDCIAVYEPRNKRAYGTGARIIEHILTNGLPINNGKTIIWLLSPGTGADNLRRNIASDLGMEYEVIARRIYDLRSKGHLVVEKEGSSKEGIITNIGVTEKGAEYLKMILGEEEDNLEKPVDRLVSEVADLCIFGLDIARKHKIDIAKNYFIEQGDTFALYEKTMVELRQLRDDIDEKVDLICDKIDSMNSSNQANQNYPLQTDNN